MDTESLPDSGNRRQRFSELMRQNHRELLVFAGALTGSREAAKDIVQESFVTAWRKFAQFDEGRDFGAWMRGIVRNKTRDWFRRQKREPIGDLELAEMEVDLASWQSTKDEGAGIFDIVDGCIGKLPGHFKHAVRTFYFEDRQGDEAAQALEISPANLRKRLQRARALLHDCIANQTQPQPQKTHV